MPFELGDGVVVHVAPPVIPTVRVTPPGPASVATVPVAGAPGEGVATLGPRVDELEDRVDELEAAPPVAEQWFSGEGPPPAVIPGAALGDMWINTLTGDLYRLQ